MYSKGEPFSQDPKKSISFQWLLFLELFYNAKISIEYIKGCR